jgi:hypothetical protein
MSRVDDAGGRARKSISTPTGWTEKYSSKYERTFWKNIITGEKVWDKPRPVATIAPVHRDAPTEVRIPTQRGNTDSVKVNHKALKDEKLSKDRSHRHKTLGENVATQNSLASTEANDVQGQNIPSNKESLSSSAQKRSPNNTSRTSKTPLQSNMINDPDWVAHHSRTYDRTYWKNKITHKSSWSCPTTQDPAATDQTASHMDDMRHTVSQVNTSSPSPNCRLRDSKSRGDSVPTAPSSAEGSKGLPMQSDDGSKRTSSNIRSKPSKKHAVRSDVVQAALNDDDSDVVEYDTKDRVSADGRWEMRYSRKSGKQYWRDVVSGVTTWRLSATAVQVADSVAHPIDAVTSKQQKGVMTKRIEDGAQGRMAPSEQKQRIKLRQSPPPPKPPKGSNVQKHSQSEPQSQSQIDRSSPSYDGDTVADPSSSKPCDTAPSRDMMTSSSSSSMTAAERPCSAGSDMDAMASPLPPGDPVSSLPLPLPTPATALLPSSSFSHSPELKRDDKRVLDMDLWMPWEDFTTHHCAPNPLWGSLLMPLPLPLHAGFNPR